MKNAAVLSLPSNVDLRDPFEPDADYERRWRARMLRNAKAVAVEAKLVRWHERELVNNVVQLETPCWLRRQAD